ncbi:unnamed protein product [Pseudo-nitzschia multistriata]|uniref:Uncharacterized protein n=1 Tax=Pseudo-nitzschia multistriata TaxID=183589 RepID=A0A448ZG86_9STRA|nr:unnamed protein product [Pseudo-nitzschia multistriata]
MFHLVDKSFKGRKEKRESASSSATAMLINKLNLPSFSQFELFDDDIRKLILSFVAEAPYQRKIGEYHQGTLTSTIPLVNKEFNSFAVLDYFWQPILRKQLDHKYHGVLWREGLRRLLPLDEDVDDEELLNLEKTIRTISAHFGNTRMGCRDIYRRVLTSHIYFDAPVFIMPCQVQMGEIYGLHLFEPRYRIMVHELMMGCENPVEASSGGKIRFGRQNGVVAPPFLIHACLGRVAPGELAVLVQLVWCHTYERGTADVRLLPVSWVRLDRIWLRRNAHNLFYAKAWRLPPQSFGS